MHRRTGELGESLPASIDQQHRRARRNVGAAVNRRLDGAAEQRQRLRRQDARDRIVVGARRRIGLYSVDHRVDAGRRGHVLGQAERQFGSSSATSGSSTAKPRPSSHSRRW